MSPKRFGAGYIFLEVDLIFLFLIESRKLDPPEIFLVYQYDHKEHKRDWCFKCKQTRWLRPFSLLI